MPAKALEARFLSSPFPSLRLWGAVSPEALVTDSLAPANDWLPAVPVPAGMAGPVQAASEPAVQHGSGGGRDTSSRKPSPHSYPWCEQPGLVPKLPLRGRFLRAASQPAQQHQGLRKR